MASEDANAGRFPSTSSSALLGALSEDRAVRRVSWERLARTYYKPVYVHLRLRWRKSEEEAYDIAQGFFARCLEKETLAGYSREKGRFRSFLRTCVDNYVVDDRRRARAAVRGGNMPFALDIASAEAEIARRGSGEIDPDGCFDAEWTRQVLALAVDALREHCNGKGKLSHFQIFERYHLESEEPPTYAALAEELSISINDVTNRLAYARRKFRGFALEVLKDITGSDEEYRSEARELLGVEL
jgi:RNA polymerase sigma factor (sigma-70 family)